MSEINADASSDMGIVPPTTATTTPAAGGATTTTAAPALANCGLYPIALSLTTVNFTATGGSLDVFNGSTPGNFGWMTWSGSNATGTLATSLTSPGDAGTYTNPNNPADHKLDLGDWVWGDPGISNASSVRDALDALIASGTTLTIPVWDNVTGNGNNTQYRVAGFALIRLTSYHLPGTNEIQAIYLGPGTCNGVTGTAAVTTTSAAPTSSTTTTTEPASCHIPLLANGSFETPITSGPNPTGWSYTGNVYRSSAFVADGSWSGLGQATSWLYQTVPAQAGANYRMTLFGGTHDPQQHAIVSMEFLNPAGQIIAATPFELDFDLDLPTGGVTAPYPTPFVNNGTGPIGGPYRINMIAPVGTSNVRISLRTTGGDYAKIDNASIVKC